MMLTGCNGCGTSGGDGPANISYTINHQVINPSPVVVSEDTVHVYGFPQTPIVNYDTNTNTLSTPDMGYAYQWYINGSPISWSTSNEHPVYLSGVYQVIAVNPQGCVSFSDTVTAVYCSPTYTPDIDIAGDSGNYLIVSNPQNGYTYEWFLEGNPISDSNSDTLMIVSGGNYSVQMVDSFGCSYLSNNFQVNLSVNNITLQHIKIYPNPTNDYLHINMSLKDQKHSYSICDNIGRVVLKGEIVSETTKLDLNKLKKGFYSLILDNGKHGIDFSIIKN